MGTLNLVEASSEAFGKLPALNANLYEDALEAMLWPTGVDFEIIESFENTPEPLCRARIEDSNVLAQFYPAEEHRELYRNLQALKPLIENQTTSWLSPVYSDADSTFGLVKGKEFCVVLWQSFSSSYQKTNYLELGKLLSKLHNAKNFDVSFLTNNNIFESALSFLDNAKIYANTELTPYLDYLSLEYKQLSTSIHLNQNTASTSDIGLSLLRPSPALLRNDDGPLLMNIRNLAYRPVVWDLVSIEHDCRRFIKAGEQCYQDFYLNYSPDVQTKYQYDVRSLVDFKERSRLYEVCQIMELLPEISFSETAFNELKERVSDLQSNNRVRSWIPITDSELYVSSNDPSGLVQS